MIFVDTGVWYETNAGRSRLGAHLRETVAEHADELATSVPVLAELWSLLAVRRNVAIATASCLDVAAHADVLGVTTDDHERALAVMRGWPDQSFSYTDATSFVLMTRERLDTVATLDDHFRIYRYGRRRERAFTVIS